ncbi:transposase [Archangium violaceum]|uniref:transposase n=1 Tax=Archangium violaceum TaxID=83451 RepID=UPI0036DC7D7A
MDLFFLDECGFAPTQPTGYSWTLRGTRKLIAYEATKGRRANALVAYGIRDGQRALRFTVKGRSLTSADVFDFLLLLPTGKRPCIVVLDNVNIHTSRFIRQRRRQLRKRGVRLFFLPVYSPELNEVEPIFGVVKSYEMPRRSYPTLAELLAAVRSGFTSYRNRLRKK